jgi:hypothetical protein
VTPQFGERDGDDTVAFEDALGIRKKSRRQALGFAPPYVEDEDFLDDEERRKQEEQRRRREDAALSREVYGLLSDYLTAEQLAEQLGVTLRTLQLWRRHKTGPPCTIIARRPHYRIRSVRAWLLHEEMAMVRGSQRRGRR